MSRLIAGPRAWCIRNVWPGAWCVFVAVVVGIGFAIWSACPHDRPALAINALIAVATLALVLGTIQYNQRHLAEIVRKATLAVLHPKAVPNCCYLAPFASEPSSPCQFLAVDCTQDPPKAGWAETVAPSDVSTPAENRQTDAMFFRLPITAIGSSAERLEVFVNELWTSSDEGEWERDPRWIPSPLCWGWPPPTVVYESLAAGSIRPWHFGFVVDPKCKASRYRHSEDEKPQLFTLVRDVSHTKQNLLACGRYKMVIELSAKGATASKWELEFEVKDGWTTRPVKALESLVAFKAPRRVG